MRATEPWPTLYARSSAASSALGSISASSRSWTLIRSPGMQPDLRVDGGRVIVGMGEDLPRWWTCSSVISAVISFVVAGDRQLAVGVDAVQHLSRARAAIQRALTSPRAWAGHLASAAPGAAVSASRRADSAAGAAWLRRRALTVAASAVARSAGHSGHVRVQRLQRVRRDVRLTAIPTSVSPALTT